MSDSDSENLHVVLERFSQARAVLECAVDSVEAKTTADTQASALRAGLGMLYHAYDELDRAIMRIGTKTD